MNNNNDTHLRWIKSQGVFIRLAILTVLILGLLTGFFVGKDASLRFKDVSFFAGRMIVPGEIPHSSLEFFSAAQEKSLAKILLAPTDNS